MIRLEAESLIASLTLIFIKLTFKIMNNYVLRQIAMLSKWTFYGLIAQLICTGILLAGDGQAQSIKSVKEHYIVIELKNNSIIEVFNKIEQKTGYNFAYEKGEVNSNLRLNKTYNGKVLVSDVLLDISEEANLKFRQVNKSIIVSEKKGKSSDSQNLEIIIQGITITGKVTSSEDSEGLPGANIIVKGSSQGTVTDAEGFYSLDVPGEESILVFSSVGYLLEEVVVGNKSVIDFVMTPDVTALQEIIVVGYGTVRKSDLTGSVASVKSEELNQFPTADPIQALQGRASGVQVQSTNGGEPGADYLVIVRGNTSINASNTPLYVVDGFPGASLPPAEVIESMEILKDASATAIYGSRGANGVIMVTTKKGNSGRVNVDFNSSYSTQNILNEYDLMNARQHGEYMNDIDAFDGSPPTYPNPGSLGEGTDWQDEILQTGHIVNNNLAISGGSDKVQYYISGNVYNQKGIILNSGFSRYSLTSNIDARLSKRIKVGVNFFARRVNNDQISTQEGSSGSQGGGVLTSALVFSPTVGIFDDDGVAYSTDPNLQGFDNPVAMSRERISEEITDYLQSNIYAEFDITNDLAFKAVLGTTAANSMLGEYESSKLFYAGDFGGIGQVSNGKNTSLLSENYLTYTKSFDSGHSLTAMAGFSYQSFTAMNSSAKGSGFLTDATEYWNLGSAAVFERPYSNLSERELISYYGRINYNFKDRYLLTVTARRDGSSTLAEGNKWDSFPSGAFSWNAHKESFLNESEVISRMKLRASYGISGNQSVSAYSSLAKLRFVMSVYNGSPVNAVSPLSLANSNLAWEKTAQANFGLDFGLFDDKVVLTADYYDMTTSDLLFDAPIPDYLGAGSTYLKNIGETRNKGIELSLGIKDIVKAINWNTNFNISFNKNEVLELPEGNDIFYRSRPGHMIGINNTHVLREGEAIGLFYGYVYEGVQQSGDELLTNAEGVGGERFRDIENDGILDDQDRTIIGDPNPDFHWGWDNNFRFKGFDLNIFFQGVQGNDILNYTRLWLEDGVGRRNSTVALLNRWTPTNTDTDVPMATTERTQRLSSRWIEDGSYIRLKNVSLGYSLPSSLVEKLNIRSLRIYVSGQNLWTSTDYKGFDPEVSTSGRSTRRGMDYGSYPNTKNYTVGLNLGF